MPPEREDYTDIREFIRDHEAYWDSAVPANAAVLQRAARLGNDAMMAVRLQLDRIEAQSVYTAMMTGTLLEG